MSEIGELIELNLTEVEFLLVLDALCVQNNQPSAELYQKLAVRIDKMKPLRSVSE